jgi:hypothetical protein
MNCSYNRGTLWLDSNLASGTLIVWEPLWNGDLGETFLPRQVEHIPPGDPLLLGEEELPFWARLPRVPHDLMGRHT